jgi:phosphopantothenoylcysteine decarboxylase/phosphopantothenate--cysteine ligase
VAAPIHVALGVGGGIAAYKAAELARALMEHGCTVEVVMTHAAQEFVRPLTFAALTGRKVITNLFGASSPEDTLSSAIEHIRLAQENQILVVAPATADLLAKFAHGLADDFLTTTYLAFKGPVVLAPAMNCNMWTHAATQANLRSLRERGHVIVEPDEGILACGMVGPGRLAETQIIVAAVLAARESLTGGAKHDLEGEVVLITAGPTQEPLDGVRYISNRSSGKMGYAIAAAARDRGARVILVSGPVHLPEPEGVEVVHVRTALEMRQAVMDRLEESSIVIKSAAVADYHRADAPRHKMKKTGARLTLELDPTPDILAEVGRKKGNRLLVGFAAETDHLIAEARRKLETKNCDMVVANLVAREGTGFEAEENEVVLVLRSGENVSIPRSPKTVIAQRICDQIVKLRKAVHAV